MAISGKRIKVEKQGFNVDNFITATEVSKYEKKVEPPSSPKIETLSLDLNPSKIVDALTSKFKTLKPSNPESRKQIENFIFGMISDDMSKVGLPLEIKANIRSNFKNVCDGIDLNFNFDLDIPEFHFYGLLSSLLALLCSGATNVANSLFEGISSTLSNNDFSKLINSLFSLDKSKMPEQFMDDLLNTNAKEYLYLHVPKLSENVLDYLSKNKKVNNDISSHYDKVTSYLNDLNIDWQEDTKKINSDFYKELSIGKSLSTTSLPNAELEDKIPIDIINGF